MHSAVTLSIIMRSNLDCSTFLATKFFKFSSFIRAAAIVASLFQTTTSGKMKLGRYVTSNSIVNCLQGALNFEPAWLRRTCTNSVTSHCVIVALCVDHEPSFHSSC